MVLTVGCGKFLMWRKTEISGDAAKASVKWENTGGMPKPAESKMTHNPFKISSCSPVLANDRTTDSCPSTVRTMSALIRSGKVRALGSSYSHCFNLPLCQMIINMAITAAITMVVHAPWGTFSNVADRYAPSINPKTKKKKKENTMFHFQTMILTMVTRVVVIRVTKVTHAPK